MHLHVPESKPRGGRGALTVGLIFAAATLGVLVLAIRSIGGPGHFRTADGVVVHGGDASTIRFTDSDGLTYSFRSDYAGSEGDQIAVHYDPRDPTRTAATHADSALGFINNFIFAALLATVSLWVLYTKWWRGWKAPRMRS